jgi:hypothetical protein
MVATDGIRPKLRRTRLHPVREPDIAAPYAHHLDEKIETHHAFQPEKGKS